MLQLAKYLRWLYELSFSIYCALLIVVEEGVKENPVVFFRLAYPILFVYGFLADVLHWAHFSPSVYRHMVALWWSMWCVLAAIIFVCLHLVRRVAPTRTALRYVGGICRRLWIPPDLAEVRHYDGLFLSNHAMAIA